MTLQEAQSVTREQRWHVDDMLGGLIEKYSDAKVLRYQAIADDTGQALFPE
jgi:hypothetical protein